ncbi:MAG: MaoC family dehydratase [Hyphomicrobiales bacterium]|nr:MaoC family dehydratase [Hyphomicrobiales bacterium]
MNKEFIGKEYEPFEIEVEKGRIAQFARSIGEENPIYFDAEAAKKAGFRGIPVPLTFAYTITMDAGQSFNVLEDMGIEKTNAVHGEQGFTYHNEICAGDKITGSQKIVDMYDKKNGALLFIVTGITLTNQDELHVADLHSVIVVRNKQQGRDG